MGIMEKMPEGDNKEKKEKVFSFEDYDITVEKNNLVEEEKEPSDLKSILQDTLNADSLMIKNKEGKIVTGGKFDEIRKDLWENKDIASVLTHNSLSFSKVGGVEFVINTLIKEKGGPEIEAIKKEFDNLTAEVDINVYNGMEVGEKRKFMSRLNELGLRLYDLCS